MTSLSNAEILMGFLVTAGTLFSAYMALRLKPIEKDLENAETETARVEKSAHDSTETLRSDFERRITALHDDSKSERENMERRLSGVERTYASRDELTQAINAIGGRFDRGIDRMEASMKDLGKKVEDFSARIAHVESAR